MLLVVPKLDKLIQNRDSWIENGMSVEKSLGLDQTLIKKLLFFNISFGIGFSTVYG